MKNPPNILARALLPALLVASAASCASHPAQDDAAKLAMYRSHAGAPVQSFHFFGRLDSWTPLGNSAVAVWTRPNEAYLLTLFGPCNDLEFTPFIGLTSSVGSVSAKFDKVLVRDTGSINMPCTIQQIQPLDVKAIKQAERGEHDASKAATADQPSGT